MKMMIIEKKEAPNEYNKSFLIVYLHARKGNRGEAPLTFFCVKRVQRAPHLYKGMLSLLVLLRNELPLNGCAVQTLG
jgi:hypothetical protein